MGRFRLEIFICLGLIVGTLAGYGQVFENEFSSYDDGTYVVDNPNVKSGLTRSNISWAFTATTASNWHPLTWLSLQLDAQFYPRDPEGRLLPWGFHFTNLLLHGASSVLLFLVLRVMTERVWPSAVVAALFAWHPLHVESVAWAAERKDVLSGMFWMLTMAAYTGYVRRPKVLTYALTLAAFALGLMAKPMLVTLPFVLLLLDYWPLQRLRLPSATQTPAIGARRKKEPDRQPTWTPRQLVVEKLPLFGLTLASCVITWYAQQKGEAIRTLDSVPMQARLANALVSTVSYLGKMALPVDLCVFYPFPLRPLPAWQVGAAAVLILGISAVALRGARTRPYLLVGWLWYLGTLVPVLGLVQVGNQAMADRYTYIPLIGVSIALVWGAHDALAGWRSANQVLGLVAAVILLFCLVFTWLQVGIWRNGFTLWYHADQVTTYNYIAKLNLGALLQKEGNLDEALEYNRACLRIEPRCYLALANIGWITTLQGNAEEALAYYRKSMEYKPELVTSLIGMGVALIQLGRYDEAAAPLMKAVELAPNEAAAWNSLGDVRYFQGKTSEAIDLYRKAVGLTPGQEVPLRNLACALHERGDVKEAGALYLQTLRLNPGWPERELDAAWETATRPGQPFRGDREPIRAATQAGHVLGSDHVRALDVRAAALAHAGEFERAINDARRALEEARKASDAARAKGIEARLRLYEQRQPFRQATASGQTSP